MQPIFVTRDKIIFTELLCLDVSQCYSQLLCTSHLECNKQFLDIGCTLRAGNGDCILEVPGALHSSQVCVQLGPNSF